MSLLVEAACVRPSRRSVGVAAEVVCLAALSIGLSACTSFRADDQPVPAARAASAPVVMAQPSPLPAMEVASAAPSGPAASAPIDPATPGDLVARRMLAYHEQLRALSPGDLTQELARLSALPVAPDISLELALALMQTRNGGELNRAIGLVDPLTKGSSPEQRQWQPFARLLLARLLELRRLEDLLDKRNQELRDSQREVRQLNEKLEALKAIERSLAPRPSSSVSPSTLSGAASFAPSRRTP